MTTIWPPARLHEKRVASAVSSQCSHTGPLSSETRKKKEKKKVDDAVDDNDGDDNDGDEFKIVSALKINGKVQFMGRIGWVALINEIIIIVVVVVIIIIIAITNTINIVVINSSQVYM